MQYRTQEHPTFETFYTCYVPLVRHTLSRLKGPYREDLDDLMQETFVRAWKAYDRLDHAQNVAAWISLIARNVARDFLRRMHTHPQVEHSLDEAGAVDLPDPSNPAQAIYDGESEYIKLVCARLSRRDQEMIALLAHGYDVREMALQLHVSLDACYRRMRVAKRHFREHYAALQTRDDDAFDACYELP